MRTLHMLIGFWLLLAAALAASTASAAAIDPEPEAKAVARAKPKYCGKALTHMLDLVCVNGFHSRIQRTRHRRLRHRRLGIVHECCYNGCLYADLERYCL